MNRGNMRCVPGCAPGRAWRGIGSPGAAGLLGAVLAVLLVFSGCGRSIQRRQIGDDSCVRSRLNGAVIAYEDAKLRFAEHFKVRSGTALRFAYMASQDSSRLALSIRGCFDFQRGHIGEARAIMRSNRVLRQLVRNNLRDSDAQQAIGIFGDQYREIFKNDID